jgi:3-deoxy-D-manno-octulosonic-acid transferase
MRILYDIFFAIFSIIYLPYLLFKGKLHRDFLQRFSLLPGEVTRPEKPVWIHAVSVGEAALASKLANAIKDRFPRLPVVVSTTTRTGNDMARKTGAGTLDAVFYFPLDFSFVVRRAVRLIDPRLFVMIETELWPNLLEELHGSDVPVVLVNGRISDGSFRNYSRIGFITRRIIGNISLFCMQSGLDAERIKRLGASPEKVHVTGNIKFDTAGAADRPGLKKEDLGFSGDDRLIVAGSTHYPEEGLVIDTFKELRRAGAGLRLVLAPRHVERIDAIKIYIENTGLSYRLFSGIVSGEDDKRAGGDILLVDTIGHLKDIYNAATLVFIGGSLARRGGQNPIEPARWGKAVIFGPHMSNFREVADIFTKGEAAVRVKDRTELKSVMEGLLRDRDRRRKMELNAARIMEENGGAVERTVERIAPFVK